MWEKHVVFFVPGPSCEGATDLQELSDPTQNVPFYGD